MLLGHPYTEWNILYLATETCTKTIVKTIAILFVCLSRNLQCDRNTIHKNLVFCLFIAEMVFLMGIAQYHIPVSTVLVIVR